ncbi:hypothetical protein EDI28_13550 [Photobacterium chitinilyticum]|uniref:Uncharacterized protein n=1 Tax=Photobacterium chitinilyticum TaxID=2485123 RepID=A0A444JNV0_9GAMM|nr:hypothetical protein EDI28_13550 [Photobacterium chitinilyticum]
MLFFIAVEAANTETPVPPTMTIAASHIGYPIVLKLANGFDEKKSAASNKPTVDIISELITRQSNIALLFKPITMKALNSEALLTTLFLAITQEHNTNSKTAKKCPIKNHNLYSLSCNELEVNILFRKNNSKNPKMPTEITDNNVDFH